MFGTLPRRVLSDARHVAARALTASAASRDKIIITGGAGTAAVGELKENCKNLAFSSVLFPFFILLLT